MKKVILGFVLGLLSLILPVMAFCKKHHDFVVRNVRSILLDALGANERPIIPRINYVDYKKANELNMHARTIGGIK